MKKFVEKREQLELDFTLLKHFWRHRLDFCYENKLDGCTTSIVKSIQSFLQRALTEYDQI